MASHDFLKLFFFKLRLEYLSRVYTTQCYEIINFKTGWTQHKNS